MSQPHILDQNARLGFVEIPGSPEGPMPALVRIEDDDGIDVDIPFSPTRAVENIFGRLPKTPPYLHFRDNKGGLTFGDCYGRRNTMDMGTRYGRWSIRAAFAVEGDDFTDDAVKKVVKIQSELTGIHQWMSWPNTFMTLKEGPDGSTEEVGITKKVLASVEVHDGDTRLRIIPTFRTKDFAFSGEDSTIETYTAEATSWADHFPLHYAIRTLVALCFWQSADFLSHRLRHSGEEPTLPNGAKKAPPLRRLHFLHHTRRTSRATRPPVEAKSEHIYFSDLGTDGIGRFIELSRTHARAIAPLMSYLYLTENPVETQMTHVGICLEALRYADRVRAGDSPNAANAESISARALALANGAPGVIKDLLGDTGEWSRKLADSYNSVKHANRSPFDPGDTFWLARSGALLARVCLLQRAGVQDEAIGRFARSPWWHPMKEGVASVLAAG
ncbi:hypothetical protein ACTI_67430 [Actinoplanes sp. OR16]|uniref:ApeA N-terminal domain 1-containing protein n=1 Tax=Actinoplanes sp. OR16 TaxID=946334 RepID=UPI000F6E95D4|nr:HEPN domain-containing protein [Actinoplanes sp. OR16]BBH70058.1 hypothetical protein ACTI_67430 [Actinoplanes sp. OR16]